jgi:hypothetical protein
MFKNPLGVLRLHPRRTSELRDFLLKQIIRDKRREPAIAAKLAPGLRIPNAREDHLLQTALLIFV